MEEKFRLGMEGKISEMNGGMKNVRFVQTTKVGL